MSFGFGFGLPRAPLRGRPLVAAIRSLFAANEPGVWYDPSDFSTLFQDAAGTVPVTAVEQPVGRILDKSGRGFHATQATATSRPVLRQDDGGKHYLYFDGVDDWMVTNTITPGTDKAQVFAGVRKLSDATNAIAVEFSENVNSKAGSFFITAPDSTGANGNYWFLSRGSTGSSIGQAARSTTLLAPRTDVIAATGDISGDLSALRVNGTANGTNGTADQGTGNYLAYPLYIGCRGGTAYPFNGHLYSLIVRFGSNLPIETIEKTEKYINTKTRAY